jgi:hypothetical protein
MIKTGTLFGVIVLICGQTFAQSGKSAADIDMIRKRYQVISSLKLTNQRFTYESSGCVEEGVANFYFYGKEIVKITESGSIGDGSWVNEYYYDKGKFFFGLETIVGGPAIGKVTKTQYRYYVKDGRAIRIMEGAEIITFDSKAAEMIGIASRIYKAYATKKFISAICNSYK